MSAFTYLAAFTVIGLSIMTYAALNDFEAPRWAQRTSIGVAVVFTLPLLVRIWLALVLGGSL